MRQVSTFRLDPFDILQCFVQSEMGGVRLYSDTVQNQDVQITQTGDRFLGNEIKIGRVGEIVKTICDHWKSSVDHLERRNGNLFADAERRVVINGMGYQLRETAS